MINSYHYHVKRKQCDKCLMVIKLFSKESCVIRDDHRLTKQKECDKWLSHSFERKAT